MTDERTRKAPELPLYPDPPVVCRKLRTKMAFGSIEGRRDWRHGDSTTAVYWCLSTMESAGPDDGFAHPHGCQSGRACFVPPHDADLVSLAGDGEGDSKV